MNRKSHIGLNAAEIEQSRKTHGANILTPPPRRPLWKQFLDKFRDPLIIILIVAGFLSVGISFYEYYALHESAEVFFEPFGIFIAILLASGLSFYFENSAEKEFAILNRVNDDEPVQVIRSARHASIARRDVVVGDIVVVNTGDEIPADGVLLESTRLNVNESSLTGEPMTAKSADPAESKPEATFPTNMLLRGTKVMEGHGIMKVTAVGDATENGKVFTAAQIDNSVKTPLDEQLARLGTMISIVSYVTAIIVVCGRVAMYMFNADFDWNTFIPYTLQSVMLAVTLVVCAVPEGLPMAVTLALAYSMRRMLKTNNLVRKLHACETMGATTVICTDKTGTLTENRMQIADFDFFGNPSTEIINESIAANSTAALDRSGSNPTVLGNPTEGALLMWLDSRNVDYASLRNGCDVVDELPFTTERKYMATVVDNPSGKRMLYLKGAPEIIYALCSSFPPGAEKAGIDTMLHGYQRKAMRTLGFAYKEMRPGETAFANGRLSTHGLTFLGIAAISDPVRADVPDAVRQVLDAGIKIKIVTGDTTETAKEIGRQIGLWNDDTDSDANIMTGPEFAELTDNEIQDRVETLKIIARARPMDKKRLVEALQRNNEIVAVTGDGTNDAPALKAAHVGLSMGDGTSVAKEASDITIIDNSFSSIGRAVMWGRSLYRNIQRFILFQVTVNVVACLTVLFGSFMGMDAPLTVTQMLWVNLIMDTFAAVALASLPPSESVLAEKPRPRSAFIITPAMWRFIAIVGGIFFVALMVLLYYLEHTSLTSLTRLGHTALRSGLGRLTPYELSVFFTVFVFMQFWNLFNARAYGEGGSALNLRQCKGFTTITALILIGQIAIVQIGGRFFGVSPLSFIDWVIIILATSAVMWVGEICRALNRK